MNLLRPLQLCEFLHHSGNVAPSLIISGVGVHSGLGESPLWELSRETEQGSVRRETIRAYRWWRGLGTTSPPPTFLLPSSFPTEHMPSRWFAGLCLLPLAVQGAGAFDMSRSDNVSVL